jgi:hypothetical protein
MPTEYPQVYYSYSVCVCANFVFGPMVRLLFGLWKEGLGFTYWDHSNANERITVLLACVARSCQTKIAGCCCFGEGSYLFSSRNTTITYFIR